LAGQSYIVAARVRAVSGSAYGTLVNLDYANVQFQSFTYLRRPPLNGSWQWVVALVTANKLGELFISMESANGVVDGSFDIAQPIVHTGTIFAGFNLGKDAALVAAVQAANTAQVAGDAALAAQLNTVQVSVSDVSASVVQESQARATVDGELSAQWSVKVDANGYWAGLTSRSYGNTSYVDILAGVFRVASASSAPEAFFTVYTVPTQINGITVQPGVYVRDLFFATLNGNKIIAQSIDTQQLKVGAVTAAQAGGSTGTVIAIPASSTNQSYGYATVTQLTTTGAPFKIIGHVTVEVVLNSLTVEVVTVSLVVVDAAGDPFEPGVDLPVRTYQTSGGQKVAKIRVPVFSYVTGYAAGLVMARISVFAQWLNASGQTVATSGYMVVSSKLMIEENKV
jgi:Domain of unknown function (DUF1983)